MRPARSSSRRSGATKPRSGPAAAGFFKSCFFEINHSNKSAVPITGPRRLYTRSTKLSTTFFSPAFSKAMVSLLPSIFTTLPARDSDSIVKQQEDVIPHSRGAIRPRLCVSLTLSGRRGRRESRVRAAPAVSCANMHKKTHTSIQVQRRQSGFPCAMVYGLLRALPGDRAFLPPSSATN